MTPSRRDNTLEVAIEQSDFPMCITSAVLDPPGPTTLYVNDAFVRLTGYSRESLIGSTPRLHQGPATDRAELDRLRRALTAGNPFDGAVWNIRRDGTSYEVEWSVIPLRVSSGNQIDYFASVQRDITYGLASRQGLIDETERMSALLHSAGSYDRSGDPDARPAALIRDLEAQIEAREHEAELSRDQAQAILKSSPVGIALIDSQHCIRQVNPALEALLGYPAREMIRHVAGRFYADEAQFRRVNAHAYSVMAAGEAYQTTVDLRRSDNRVITVSIEGQAIGSTLDEGSIWVVQDVTEQRARERALRTYQAVFESSRDAVVFTDENGRFTDVNPAAMALFEIPDRPTFLRDFPTPEAVSPALQPDGQRSADAAIALIEQAFEKGQVLFEWQQQSATGRLFPVEILLSRIDLDDGPILESTVRDISDKKAAMDALRRARDRAETYFEAVPVMVLVLDIEGRVTEINQSGCELIGLPREAILATHWFDRFVPADEGQRLWAALEGLRAGRARLAEYRENIVITASGEHRTVAFRNVLLRDDAGVLQSILASGIDVTHQREIEADLEYRATHDALTGLYNRRRMTELLDAEMQRAQRHGGAFSVILFDADHFKAINDQHGHDVGDAVLKALVGSVRERLRDVDSLARWGGEEFLVLLPATEQADAYKVAEALRRRVEATDFPGVGQVTISLGVAAFTENESMEELLKRVDNRAYAAKSDGRNRTL